jgi:hypothetical protein
MIIFYFCNCLGISGNAQAIEETPGISGYAGFLQMPATYIYIFNSKITKIKITKCLLTL